MAGKDVWYYDDPIESGWPRDKDMISHLKRRVAQYCREGSETKRAYVGKASGNKVVDAMKRHQCAREYNVMIALYRSESKDGAHCYDVKDELVKHFKSKGVVVNKSESSGGGPSGAQWHYVFVALQTPDVHYWDDMQGDLEACKKYVKKYSDKEHVEKYYIGIASGGDEVSAIKRRYDDTKKKEGLNEVIAIYETSTQDECRDIETQLIEEFREDKKMINKRGGGGGAPSDGPNYYVYLAVRITPAGH